MARYRGRHRAPTNTGRVLARTAIAGAATVAPLAAAPAAHAEGTVWDKLAQCESTGNWAINTGNGYYGAYQFTLSTWRSVGGRGYPNQNSLGEQTYRAEILRQRVGLGQWPVCGRYYR